MKNKHSPLIAILLLTVLILGCAATEVTKVPPADALKQTTDETKTATAQAIKNSQLTDEQILVKYDDGLDEAMKELDEIEE